MVKSLKAKKIALLSVLFVIQVLCSGAFGQCVKCIRVVDGDTITIIGQGKIEKVRLIGVDTPETVHPNKPVEYFGKEAMILPVR
jgi:endonuclease YncB( thermonuclease family)